MTDKPTLRWFRDSLRTLFWPALMIALLAFVLTEHLDNQRLRAYIHELETDVNALEVEVQTYRLAATTITRDDDKAIRAAVTAADRVEGARVLYIHVIDGGHVEVTTGVIQGTDGKGMRFKVRKTKRGWTVDEVM